VRKHKLRLQPVKPAQQRKREGVLEVWINFRPLVESLIAILYARVISLYGGTPDERQILEAH
jgi:hypothetical protein